MDEDFEEYDDYGCNCYYCQQSEAYDTGYNQGYRDAYYYLIEEE